MEKIKKYLLLFFLIENIAAQTSLLGGYVDLFFYSFLVIGAFFILNGEVFSSENRKKFGVMYVLMAIYLIYEFIVGFEYLSSKTLLYVVAKIVTFGIIITSIGNYKEYYENEAIRYLVLFMAFFLIYGVLTGQGMSSGSGRIRAGFTNENTTGGMGAMIIGMVLFYMKDKIWSYRTWILLVTGCFGVLAGGSRAGFLMLFILVLLRYGMNIKTIMFGLLFLIFGLFILPKTGIKTVGLERLYATYQGKEKSNREIERAAGIWMIEQSPWNGHGFNAQNKGYAASLTNLGSHNGYLETYKFMGIPMATLYFLTIFISILSYLLTIRRYGEPISLYGAMVLMLLVKSMYEGLMVGVHEYETTLFFTSLAMISAEKFEIKRIIEDNNIIL